MPRIAPPPNSLRGGFTLTELLITTAILAVLAVLVIPSVTHMTDGAARAGCVGKLREVHTALTSYAADNRGFFPPAQNEREDSITWIGTLQHGGYVPNVSKTATPSRYPLFCPGSKVRDDDHRANVIYANYGINTRVAGRVRTDASKNTQALPAAAVASPAKTFLVMDAGAWMVYPSLETAPSGPAFYLPGLPANRGFSWQKRYAQDAEVGRHRGNLNVLMVDGHVESLPARDFRGEEGWDGTL